MNSFNFKSYFKENLFLIIFIALVITGLLYSKFNVLFFTETLKPFLLDSYLKYGLIILFIIGLIEGFLFFGVYWFGGVLMFLSVLYARNPLEVFAIIIVVWLALVVNSFLNYYIGNYFKRFDIKHKLIKKEIDVNFKLKNLLYLFHTTSIAYFCFYLGYK